MGGPLWKNLVRESGTERIADPHRPGHADGRSFPALLAAGAARGGAAGARLRASARQASGRAADRLSRYAEPARPDRRILRAPRRVTLVRAERRGRAALLLPRLEVRRHRPVRRDSLGARQLAA